MTYVMENSFELCRSVREQLLTVGSYNGSERSLFCFAFELCNTGFIYLVLVKSYTFPEVGYYTSSEVVLHCIVQQNFKTYRGARTTNTEPYIFRELS